MPGLREMTKKKTMLPATLSKAQSDGDAIALLKRDFALHCRRLRIGMQVTQDVFAKKMGVSNGVGKITISRWESGSCEPQKRYLERFLVLQRRYDKQESE